MKALPAFTCFLFSFTTMCYSQEISEKDLPNPVKTAFTAKYPGASHVKWGKENAKEYEVEFKLNNTDVSADFKMDGRWVETETTIPASALPAAVSNAVKTKYPEGVFGSTEKIEKPGGQLLYEVYMTVNGKRKELESDPDGSIVK